MAGTLRRTLPLTAAEPLWKRVPTRDAAGRPLTDLLIWVPGLCQGPDSVIRATLEAIRLALLPVPEVVFAEFDLRRNLLWISLRVRRRVTLEVAARVLARVPQARLVCEKIVF